MEIIPIITHHFVKSEDLNHHGTLFAGRTAEWFVEAGLMSAAAYLQPENIVCVKIHGMNFKKPIKLGHTIKFISKIVFAGKTSLTSNIQLFDKNENILNGFLTFVNVDADGEPLPHGITIDAADERDADLQRQAKELRGS